MPQTVAVIEATPAALPTARARARRLGGKTLLEWVIRRACESTRLAGVVVLASPRVDVTRLRHLLPSNIPVYQDPTHDTLLRWISIAERHEAAGLVWLSAANPFIDAALIDRLVATADEHGCDYLSYCSHQHGPVIQAALGGLAEWLRVSALRDLARLEIPALERQVPTRALAARPERFTARWLPMPAELDRPDLRLAVEHDEDWDHAEAIFDALGHEGLDWQQIARFLNHQPRLRERMADLNRKLPLAS